MCCRLINDRETNPAWEDEGSFPKGKGKKILGRRHRHSRTLNYQGQEGSEKMPATITYQGEGEKQEETKTRDGFSGIVNM